ncbi:hypothetical protein PAXRUDRAFT_20797 [Paxillus rubicundulus Ve08.2h10]|uniref:Uncharacterized protein n=1 Tax=Paxillus rubicundulus Ve08.2h10 TaxID=930991 RepID=A0A0D0CRS7_9AGAM|nr:hypothetical protein PAXRUDRAFT_20797 [Paxillus rubicundulus Ve08.2h10]
MDHVQCLGNLPSEIALATRVIAMAVMQGLASQINRDYGKFTEDPRLPHPWGSDVNQQLPEHYQELRWEEFLSLYAGSFLDVPWSANDRLAHLVQVFVNLSWPYPMVAKHYIMWDD